MAVTGALLGASLLSGALGRRRAKKERKKQMQAQKKQAAYMQQLSSPQNYANLINQYRGQFQEGYMPSLRGIGDTLALNEQNSQQEFNAEAARRGLSGSGMAFAGQNSIRSARMAGLGEAQRAYQTDVENAARGAAGQTIQNQMYGGANFSPYPYVAGPPGALETLLSSGSQGLGLAAQYGQMTGGSGNLGSLLGLKGGPDPNTYGPPAPYYVGNAVGRG